MSEEADPSTGVDGQAPDTTLNRVATITAQIARLQQEHQIAVGQAIEGGTSWAALGAALGVSAQAAHKRFRWLRWNPSTGVTWHEPPLPIGSTKKRSTHAEERSTAHR